MNTKNKNGGWGIGLGKTCAQISYEYSNGDYGPNKKINDIYAKLLRLHTTFTEKPNLIQINAAKEVTATAQKALNMYTIISNISQRIKYNPNSQIAALIPEDESRDCMKHVKLYLEDKEYRNISPTFTFIGFIEDFITTANIAIKQLEDELKKMSTSDGGSKQKLHILGRSRNIIIQGRSKLIRYKNQLINVSQARAIERDLRKNK